jgi:hypothetical protein
MANRIVVYWRDIPAQVIIKKGRATAKRELSLRFTEAIDMCAMRTGAAETDDYLAEWRRADPVEVSDDLEAEADKAAAELEAAYDKERLVALVKGGGRESPWLTNRRNRHRRASTRRRHRRRPTSPRGLCDRPQGAQLCGAGSGRCGNALRWSGSTPALPTSS